MEHPTRGTLDDLLAGGALTAGEAVTVLIAMARRLSALHAEGIAGIPLAPRDVGFRDDGCPVLTAVGRLRELDQQTMADDVAAFAALAGTICSAVAGEPGAAVLVAATNRGHRSWEDVAAGLLRAADPTAVRAPDADSIAAMPARPALPRTRSLATRWGHDQAALWAGTDTTARSVGRDHRLRLDARVADGRSVPRNSTAPSRRRESTGRSASRDSRSGSPGRRSAARPIGRERTSQSAGRASPPRAVGRAPAQRAASRTPPARSATRDFFGALEQVLDLLGDRPVGRAGAAARSWIAARPLLVAVGAAPVLATVLLLVVLPGAPAPPG
ncbi:hypothetical protein [Leifsonia shinshuensis]